MARAGERAVVWDRPELRALCPPDAVPYDAPEPVLEPGGSRFRLAAGSRSRSSVPGAHNAVNAAGALTAARAGRRRSRRAPRPRSPTSAAPGGGSSCSARPRPARPVYDDYAHHPTEVAAAIAAARTLAPRAGVAVFQPHLYSRTRALAREFGRALAAADIAVVLDVYPARERAEDFPGVDGRLVAAAAADAGERAPGGLAAGLRRRPAASSARRCAPGDLCLVMGAGRHRRARPRSLVG